MESPITSSNYPPSISTNSPLTIRDELKSRLKKALVKSSFPEEIADISSATVAKFGDYQSHVAMVLAKRLGENPRTIARQILAHLHVSDMSAPPDVAGAGFLNFRILDQYLADRITQVTQDSRMGVPLASPRKRIVVDFSSPNVAKPMHVGHIRSTVLGDALVRIARFLGHDVITDNHIGDWGTQFGKVIYGWKHFLDPDDLAREPVEELVRLYRKTNQLGNEDPAIARQAREELVLLQRGDPENLVIWKQTVELSWKAFESVYKILDVHFTHCLGESFYNQSLSPLVEHLLATEVAQPSEGAICIFFPEIPELADKPCMIRKSDGGFLYATTDLATLEYRIKTWNPDTIWYVTGAPQALHFQQIFAIARRLGISAELVHIAFGNILREDRKMMKTREGENVSLATLLNEAIERAAKILTEKNPSLPLEEQEKIAHAIGIGAVKYAEFSQHRLTDYVFSWDKMLSFQGNTAPYLQNAYVRIRSIFRKSDEIPKLSSVHLDLPEERALALRLLQFGETVPIVLEEFRPNLLANYLFELANSFHSFYEKCPVLRAEEGVRESRLTLCNLSARVLAEGLSLLGIQVPERM